MMLLTRRWHRALITVTAVLATWFCLIRNFIPDSADNDDDDADDTPSSAAEISTDFDGTASGCRCQDVGRAARTRFWPPLDTRDLLCPQDGTYDMTLCVDQLTDSHQRSKLTQRLALLKSKHPYARVSGSELRQWYQLEEARLRRKYDLYPMAMNILELITNISLGIPVTATPITNPNIKLLRVSQSICPPTGSIRNRHSRHKLVVVYKSGIYNFDDRLKIRAAYSQLADHHRRIGIVFAVGMPRSTGENTFHMNGYAIQLPERAGSALREWSGRSQEALSRVYEEADLYDDLILGDYEDTYVNLTYKLITSYRWASAFCRGKVDTFLFLDDDYRFSASQVLSYLDTLKHREKTHLLAGGLMSWRKVIRPFRDPSRNKWALTADEVPWSDFPTYFSGRAYLMGMNVIHDLVIAAAYTRWLWVDDVYLGFVLTKLPYIPEALRGFYTEFTNQQKALVYHSPASVTFRDILDSLYQLRNSLNI